MLALLIRFLLALRSVSEARASREAEILVLRQQLMVLSRRSRKRVRLRNIDRLIMRRLRGELARKLNVSAAFLSDIELDIRHPSDELFQRLAKILTRFSCEERVGFRFSSRANPPESFEAKVPGRAGQAERSA